MERVRQPLVRQDVQRAAPSERDSIEVYAARLRRIDERQGHLYRHSLELQLGGRGERPLAEGLGRIGEEGVLARMAGGFGYQQVCGDAAAWGDGITPVPSAHLPGAEQLTLEGVYHSPLGQAQADAPWYGDAEVVEQWVEHLME